MGNSDARRCGAALAVLLAAGAVRAVEFNSSLAPLILALILHIYLRPPEAVEIGGKKVQALTAASIADSKLEESKTDSIDPLLMLRNIPEGILEQGETLMFTMTIPPELPMAEPIIIAQSTQTQRGPSVDFVVKDCQAVEHASSQGDGGNVLGPQNGLARLLQLKDGALDALVRLEKSPEHGQLHRIAYYRYDETRGKEERTISRVYMRPDGSVPEVPRDTDTVRYVRVIGEEYRYITNPSFFGKDRTVFSVDYKGKQYRIDLEIRVYDYVPQASEGIGCPTPRLIKVIPKQSDAGSDSIEGRSVNSELHDLRETSIDSVQVDFAPLSNASLAQTTGTGLGAQITLDTTAAGHGWYIDYTPYLNEEYLPTANPNEWIAKADSEAAGKMDMLSVLLHEYGHALGIEHSVSAHDYMATTLAPGVRRLPSADELALMAKLAVVNRGQTTFSRYHPDTLQATSFQKSPPCRAAPGLPCPTFPCI